MLIKIYWTIWALFALVAATTFAAGYLTAVVLVSMGFFAFGLVFMGMIGVLPSMVSHAAPVKKAAPPIPAAVTPPAEVGAPANAFGGVLKSA